MNSAALSIDENRCAITNDWSPPSPATPVRFRACCESFVPIALVILQIIFLPLTHPQIINAAIVASAVVALYLLVGLTLLHDSRQRWHLLPPTWNDRKCYLYGAVGLLLIFAVGVGPIFALRQFDVHMPNPGSPWIYLAWCTIQDFVFFSLILRGLSDQFNSHVSIWITAILFGISHFPSIEVMIGTLFIAAAWGYLFLKSRWLLFVIASHWFMGWMLLAR